MVKSTDETVNRGDWEKQKRRRGEAGKREKAEAEKG